MYKLLAKVVQQDSIKIKMYKVVVNIVQRDSIKIKMFKVVVNIVQRDSIKIKMYKLYANHVPMVDITTQTNKLRHQTANPAERDNMLHLEVQLRVLHALPASTNPELQQCILVPFVSKVNSI
jgi:hypothetical protein